MNSNNKSDLNLPTCLHKVDSVSKVPSQHGYDAYDKDKNYIGSFDNEGAFLKLINLVINIDLHLIQIMY